MTALRLSKILLARLRKSMPVLTLANPVLSNTSRLSLGMESNDERVFAMQVRNKVTTDLHHLFQVSNPHSELSMRIVH